ncbi:MAG: sulfotransferase domain-containing protein [Candidatus Moraniibacteriota bacterium]
MKQQKKPNFFIVGFPKCGTTTLYHCLKQHPEIFMSPVKEPDYFCTDLHRESDAFHKKQAHFFIREKKDYLRLFSKAKKEKIIGEASTTYSYSKEAPKNIFRFNSKAKILFLIREPVSFMQSMHFQQIYNKEEHEKDFSKALSSQEEKLKKTNCSPSYPTKIFYSYLACFNKHIENYQEIFPSKQIKIITLDELKQDPKKTFGNIFEFLEVDEKFNPVISIENSSKTVKSTFIHTMMRAPSSKRVAKAIIPTIVCYKIYDMLTFLNSTPKKKPSLPVLKKTKLKRQFLPEVKELEKTTGKNLLKLWKYNEI